MRLRMEIRLSWCSFLIDNGADVKAKNEGDENALFEHITRGKTNLKIVEILLDNGIKVNSKSKHYGTVLHWAAFCGRTEIVKLLIEQGANVNAKGDMGETPVQKAMSQNELETVKVLFKLGADPLTSGAMGFSLLEFAIDLGDKEFVKEIISKIREKSKGGLNALTTAAKKGDLDMVKLLVEAGFDVDDRDSFGSESPLIKASYYGKLQVVKYLLEKGADIKLTDYKGNTALLNAAYNGHTDVVKELLKNGAEINERNNHNWNALMQACIEGHYETAKFLLEKGSPTDEIDKEKGATALTLAKYSGSKKLIELLESYGAKERETKMRKKGEPYFSLFDCEICAYLPDKKDLGRTEYPETFEGLEIVFDEVTHSDRYCDDTRRIMKCKNCGTYYYQYHSIDTEDAFVGGPSISQDFMRINLVWLKRVLEFISKKKERLELEKRYPALIEECLKMLKKKRERINPNHLKFVIESLTDYYIKKDDWEGLKKQLLQHDDAEIVLQVAKDLVIMYGETAWKWDFPHFTNYKSVFPEYQETFKQFLDGHKDELKQIIMKYKNAKDEKISYLYKSVMDSAKYYKVF
jgi:ankyrin repeat protein